MPDPTDVEALARLLTDPPARKVLHLLTEGGHRAWIVGGAVRDALLGRPLGDIDVTSQDVAIEIARGLEKDRWFLFAHISE